MRRPDDHDAPPPPVGAAVAVVDAGRAQRSAELAARRSRRREGRVVKVGLAVVGEWRRPTRIKRAGLGTVQKERASLRLAELAVLGQWRQRHGVITDVAGWLAVAANALLILDGTDGWRLDAEYLLGQLPPGVAADDDQIERALRRPRGNFHLLANGPAGRLVELVAVEHNDIILDRKPFRTLDPHDETAGERAARRAERKRQNAARRQARLKARRKVVTPDATSPVTPQREERSSTKRYPQRVALDVTTAVAAGASTVEDIARALGREPEAVRRAVERAAEKGLIARPRRGRYAPAPASIPLVAGAEDGSAPPAAANKRYAKGVTGAPAMVLAALGRMPSATASELSRELGRSRNAVAMGLLRLVRNGEVVRLDDGRHALPTSPPPSDPTIAGGGLPPLPAREREEQK